MTEAISAYGARDIYAAASIPKTEHTEKPAAEKEEAAPKNRDELILSDSAKAISETSGDGSGKRLSDKEIFEIFTGRPVTKAQKSPFGSFNMAGSEDMFDENGSFIYKDNEEIVSGMRNFYQITVFSGVPLDEQDKEHLASFFGNVGKRIDEAYASGRCSGEQKKELENMLKESADYYASMTERSQAGLSLGRERAEMSPLMKDAFLSSRASLSEKERLEEFRKEIESEADTHFKIDRKELFEMINRIRYGFVNMLKKQ